MQPTRTFRTIRGSKANYKVAFYTTKERRDAAGQRDADKDGQHVLLEEWTPELDECNDVNQGWGCDGVARPQGQPEHEHVPVEKRDGLLNGAPPT
jgi:hypothetical protein